MVYYCPLGFEINVILDGNRLFSGQLISTCRSPLCCWLLVQITSPIALLKYYLFSVFFLLGSTLRLVLWNWEYFVSIWLAFGASQFFLVSQFSKCQQKLTCLFHQDFVIKLVCVWLDIHMWECSHLHSDNYVQKHNKARKMRVSTEEPGSTGIQLLQYKEFQVC